MRTLLLIFQATLSVVLLVGAGLFVRSLHNVRSMRLGYDVGPLLVVSRNMRGVSLTDSQQMALEHEMADEAQATPGVMGATQAASVPFWSNEGRPLFVPGVDTVSKLGRFLLQSGNPGYFKTLGTRVVRGRAFDASDRAGGPRVIVVSEGMANALWPAGEPLGKCVRIGAETAPCSTVIGVAEDIRSRSLGEDHEYTYYLPIAQYDAPTGMLFVRVTGRATEYAEIVRRRLQRLMPGAAYVTVQPLQNMVDPTMQSWRFGATMFVAFGGLALALAGIGLYSMIAYGVAQRRQEIGIRIALGASRANVVRLVVRGGLRLVIVGVIAGGAISLWSGRWLATLLFRESPSDPAVYGGVAAVLIGVSLVATVMPAIAASRLDPNVALRAD
jgi:predicted permease